MRSDMSENLQSAHEAGFIQPESQSWEMTERRMRSAQRGRAIGEATNHCSNRSSIAKGHLSFNSR